MSRDSVQFAAVVTAAGTPVPLSTESFTVTSLTFVAGRATAANTGPVFVGDSGVSRDTAKCIVLNPGDSWDTQINPSDPWRMNTIFVDADNDGDGVIGLYRLL